MIVLDAGGDLYARASCVDPDEVDVWSVHTIRQGSSSHSAELQSHRSSSFRLSMVLKNTNQIRRLWMTAVSIALLMTTGCQGLKHWWHNDLKVGPNYAQTHVSELPVSQRYIDTNLPEIDPSQVMDDQWWCVFNDPDLNILIESLRDQNLSLKAAYYRICEGQHLRDIAAANLFPQSQTAAAGYTHNQVSRNSATSFPGLPLTSDDWSTGFDAGWEIDLWGRIRRSVAAAEAGVEARVHDYNFAMVSLIGETASLYVQIRALDERIELARKNVVLQEGSLDVAEKRFKEGRTSKLDVVQAESSLASTRSLIPQFELVRRQSLNALAVLLGVPPGDICGLDSSSGRIPEVPPQIIVGIPAELICRRPDIRAAERTMAAQFEQIGIAKADLYPTFTVSGSVGLQSARLSDLFESASFNGAIAPGFRWNILNYGRLQSAICVEEAVFKQIQADFENTVLTAQREVEDGIIEFIKRNEQYEFDLKTAQANEESVELALASFKEGKTDFGRVFVVQSNLVLAQDKLVETRTSIALALINTYRALGGGWQTDSGCGVSPQSTATLASTRRE